MSNTNHSIWHQLNSEDAARQLDVDPSQGLNSTEAAQRLETYGPNKLAEAKKEPRWQAFLRQYRDFMQIVLLVAAIISFIMGDTSSAVVLVLLTILNAVLGLRQESKAEESLAALKGMMRIQARVRRDGKTIEISADEIVPGDIALFEAGDRVPADGRLLVAASLEIEESALTGESTPVAKETDPVADAEAALGDRVDMAYMQSSVTRGRGEMLVTATGMDTEVGHIAGMLQSAKVEKTPLTKQLDHLTLIIAGLAGLALVLIVIIGLVNGDPLDQLFSTGVALAIAAIPTGLPIIVTTLLALGTMELAQRNAIVKRLPSVETLGSTSAICSDKTGTLTLNQMTARVLLLARQRFAVTGEGYSSNGQIRHVGGFEQISLDPVLLPMALCSDAVVENGELVGDPTEGALVTLAQKGGLEVRATRQTYPRIAEVPFDSAYKLMATFHEMTNEKGEAVVREYVKGAPDVLIARGTKIRGPQGQVVPIDDEMRPKLLEANEELAGEGLRVLVVAERDFDPQTFDQDATDLLPLVEELTLLAMIGIVDPPRPEAKTAIAECKSAGIQVRMITGDHASTAAAIGRELGIAGRAITGAEFAHMTDEEVNQQIGDIGVIARVAPEDKVRLVQTLQAKNNIVAMTGDGVNDAPALKTADIGVAMGITGTEVSKESADMILIDDNFATIVTAVEYGRGLYDNLMKYIRFQMVVLVGFILAFVGSALFKVAGTALFLPLQILWVNFLIDAPIAVAMGRDTTTPGLMQRKPRKANDPIISRRLGIRLTVGGIIMAAITLLVYQWAQTVYRPSVAQTMALITFSLSHIFFALNLRHPYTTIFKMETLTNRNLLYAFGLVLLAMILTTELPLLQRIFDAVSLDSSQWVVCVVAAAIALMGGELLKLIYKIIKQDKED